MEKREHPASVIERAQDAAQKIIQEDWSEEYTVHKPVITCIVEGHDDDPFDYTVSIYDLKSPPQIAQQIANSMENTAAILRDKDRGLPPQIHG